MGKSADFSEGIKIIREAHSDAVAVLEKWKELLESPGDVTLTVRSNDTVEEIILPSIRAAINRYLGGIFEQVTLTDGTNTVILRLNQRGQVELIDGNGDRANMSTRHLIAQSISGSGENLPISGTVQLSGGTIYNGTIQNITVQGGQIFGATFKGPITIEGSTQINGDVTARNATIENLNIQMLTYRKQVLNWAVEGVTDANLVGSVNAGLWVGDPAVLEAAGIYEEPTWCDCQYIPAALPINTNHVVVYWGEDGAIPIQAPSGSSFFITTFMALWPYKMYEKVGNAYRIRWLPFEGQEHRITYVRTGNTALGIPLKIEVVSTGSGLEVSLLPTSMLPSYQCRRFIAEIETETRSEGLVATHCLYAM